MNSYTNTKDGVKNMSKIKNMIPMSVPKIGNNNQQPMFDATQSTGRQCECGSVYFDKCCKIKTVSKLAPGNSTNQDIILEVPVYVCRDCEKELVVIESKV